MNTMSNFAALLEKPFTRKQFLLHLGMLALVLSGAAGLLKTLSNPQLASSGSKTKTGFGAGPYGG